MSSSPSTDSAAQPSTNPPSVSRPCCCSAQEYEGSRTLQEKLRKSQYFGRALLVRYEAHVAEADSEKDRMMAQINLLTLQRSNLEVENTRFIGENRALLNQLAEINIHAKEAEERNDSLGATLKATQAELTRLSSLASRTRDLESQLLQYEEEKFDLRNQVLASEEQEQRAIKRWHEAEKSLGYLEDQMTLIESERHDRAQPEVGEASSNGHDISFSESPSSEATALARTRHMTHETPKGSVMGPFIRDLLQDNSNLQSSIVEMRELLRNTCEEVYQLRMEARSTENKSSSSARHPPTMQDLITTGEPAARPSEVHVHHHYHNQPTFVSPKKSTKRRIKQAGPAVEGRIFSDSDANVPGSPTSWIGFHPAKASGPVARPLLHKHTRSNSTNLGSPISSAFDGSIVDDSTRPTSPETEASYALSPSIKPQRSQRRGLNPPTSRRLDFFTPSDPIFEESTDTAPPLRRSASHESILSISPLEEISGRRTRHPLNKQPSSIISKQSAAVASLSIAIASPSMVSASSNLRSGGLSRQLADNSSTHSDSPSVRSQASATSAPRWKPGAWMSWSKPVAPVGRDPSADQTKGKVAASPATPSARSMSTAATPTQPIGTPSATPKAKAAPREPSEDTWQAELDAMALAMGGRTPGVNQRGPVPGFLRPKPSMQSSFRDLMIAKTDKDVQVDAEGLREALE